MSKTILCLMALAPLALGGCLVSPEPESGPPACQDGRCGDDDDDSDDGLFDPAPRPTAATPEEVAATANVFRAKCADCHGKGQSFGGLPDLFDVPELKRRNLIGPNSERSAFFDVIRGGSHGQGVMNPRTGRPPVPPNAQDLRFVRRWVDAGAPDLRGNRNRLDLGAYADRLRADATKAPGANDLVYVDFHAAYNNNERFSDAALAALANATIKLLNQLDVRAGAPKREGASVVRDDKGLPLAVRFQASAFGLDPQRDVVGTLLRLANRHDPAAPFACAVPTIPALDFVHVASSDDVYNPLADGGQGAFESGYANVALRRLLVDAGLLAEEQRVFEPAPEATFIANGFTNVSAGVDLYDVLAALDPSALNRPTLDALYNAPQGDGRLLRGCVADSGTSAAQRCIDRLTQSGPAGLAAYLSFDTFAVNQDVNQGPRGAAFFGPAGPAADPLVRPTADFTPFAIDGGQGIVQLKNALLGFFSFGADFRLVSNTPTYPALEDASPARTSFASTAACAYCHQSFAVPFQDVVVPSLLRLLTARDDDPPFPQFNLLQTRDDWGQTFDLDAQRYGEALRRLYPVDAQSAALALRPSTPQPLSPLYDGVSVFAPQYRYDLSVEDMVAELGLANEAALFEALEDFSELADVGTPLEPAIFGGGMSRDNFTANYQLLVELVGEGNEDFLHGCVARTADDLLTPMAVP